MTDKIGDALSAGYLLALCLPHDRLRMEVQDKLCLLRDAVAEHYGRDAQEVQNDYESAAMFLRHPDLFR